MKIDGNTPLTKQTNEFKKEEKENKPTGNQSTASIPQVADNVTLANTTELPKEIVSKESALTALSKVIETMNQSSEADLNSLYKPLDPNKISELLQP